MLLSIVTPVLVFLAGVAALSWQVLWQVDLSLALGVSAKGTALTVATAMAGMTLGALWSGRRAEKMTAPNPWRSYALLELGIGLAAWLPRLSIPWIERLDAAVFQFEPAMATPFSLLALAFTLGPASFLMGATLPVMGLVARREGMPLSKLYAANTIGAACGSLLIALVLMPQLGRAGAASVVLTLDVTVALAAWVLSGKKVRSDLGSETPKKASAREPVFSRTQGVIFALVTGFSTFVLEVAWFRLLRAGWLSTTDSFAVMLFCFLLGLGIGGAVSRHLSQLRTTLPVLLCLSAVAIWLGTPALERMDLWADASGGYTGRMIGRIVCALLAMGPAVVLIGTSLPSLMDDAGGPRRWAWLYAVNTLGAVVGSGVAAWCLMGWLGPVQAAWAAGGLLAVVAFVFVPSWWLRAQLGTLCLIAFTIAWATDSGIGRVRVQGPTTFVKQAHQILRHRNGPDVTTSVVRTQRGFTMLFIDGYAASGEVAGSTSYMDAMGRLPMLLHKSPRDALVVCFGTGQTVRAVADEGARTVTVVDLNAAVFDFADAFSSNRSVLCDPKVNHQLMDGRAWLRRQPINYDVVTLEPMPPFFAGSNSLYSVEFYQLIHRRLRAGGYASQWFPTHLLTPPQACAVAAAFVKVFPNAILWFDPNSRDATGTPQQGILIGHKGTTDWTEWPGYDREPSPPRPYDLPAVKRSVVLSPAALARYATGTPPVTDDNQILSFGAEGLHHLDLTQRSIPRENGRLLQQAADPVTR